jgi:cytochrome d ubiquinol oxidase subunit I
MGAVLSSHSSRAGLGTVHALLDTPAGMSPVVTDFGKVHMGVVSESTDVSRILFGFATEFHYLFVPLTIGLMAVIAILDAAAWRTRKPVWQQASLFWGRFFILNFVCGVVTGWPLRHHIEQQWTGFAQMAGDVFQHVFAIEARIAPWLFGLVILFALRGRLPLLARFAISATLAVVLVAQSVAILALNAWMQHPVGVEMVDGRLRLLDPSALFANPLLPAKVLHTMGAAYVLGGMFVIAISAWFLLRAKDEKVAKASVRVAAGFTLVALVVTGLAGHWSGELVARYQPAKFAAIEALWKPAKSPALTLVAVPDAQTRSNRHAVELPHVLGWLAGDGVHPIKSIQDIEQETEGQIRHALVQRKLNPGTAESLSLAQYQRDVAPLGLLSGTLAESAEPSDADIAAAAQRSVPAVAPLFWGFRAMVGSWVLLMVVVGWLAWRGADARSTRGRMLLWACVLALPFPWIANGAGWIVCEMGRQPWTVAGVLTTGRSGGQVSAALSAFFLLGWGCVYAGLALANVLLSLRWIRRGAVSLLRVAPQAVPRFSLREKRRIVREARQPGASVELVASKYQLGVHRLQRWMLQQELAAGLEAGRMPGKDASDQQMKLAALRHDVARLRRERDALKRVLSCRLPVGAGA